jgi:opacity protein-like surface antigen
MKKILAAALLLMVFASPAFAAKHQHSKYAAHPTGHHANMHPSHHSTHHSSHHTTRHHA